MNIYELIGRLILLHHTCEDIFSLCGRELDVIMEDTKAGDDSDCSPNLLNISAYIESLKSTLDEYSSIVNKQLSDNIVENSESS